MLSLPRGRFEGTTAHPAIHISRGIDKLNRLTA